MISRKELNLCHCTKEKECMPCLLYPPTPKGYGVASPSFEDAFEINSFDQREKTWK